MPPLTSLFSNLDSFVQDLYNVGGGLIGSANKAGKAMANQKLTQSVNGLNFGNAAGLTDTSLVRYSSTKAANSALDNAGDVLSRASVETAKQAGHGLGLMGKAMAGGNDVVSSGKYIKGIAADSVSYNPINDAGFKSTFTEKARGWAGGLDYEGPLSKQTVGLLRKGAVGGGALFVGSSVFDGD